LTIDLQRILVDSTDGVQNGHELVAMTQELERVRRAAETQHAEFEVMKRNLVRDITDRCEKVSTAHFLLTDADSSFQVVELQIALDEYKEKYRAIAKATNAKAYEKEMKVMTYNMNQMYEVQRSVSPISGRQSRPDRPCSSAREPEYQSQEGSQYLRAPTRREKGNHHQPRKAIRAVGRPAQTLPDGTCTGPARLPYSKPV
jgi:hypothetical protein